ncbi:MAG: archease [Kiloniellales bacterium]|nr:archease [Kiloniellales bacterium]
MTTTSAFGPNPAPLVPDDGVARRGWSHEPHDADIRIRAWGPTPAAAFEEAAAAMTAATCDPERVRARTAIRITCTAPDRELLLVEWLNALVYEMATRGMVFGRFQVLMDDHRLQAIAWGEPLDRARHRPAVEVKGATYTALRVAPRDDGTWVATCVVDV